MSILEPLNILLNAPSKVAIEQLVNLIFVTRHQSIIPIPESSQTEDNNGKDIYNPIKVTFL
jgi:hypothetical protein